MGYRICPSVCMFQLQRCGRTWRHEVLKAMEIHIVVYWVMTPCTLVGGSRCFRGTQCLHVQGTKEIRYWGCRLNFVEPIWGVLAHFGTLYVMLTQNVVFKKRSIVQNAGTLHVVLIMWYKISGFRGGLLCCDAVLCLVLRTYDSGGNAVFN